MADATGATQKARAFLTANHRAILSTFRSDGRPQLSPVTVAIDDQDRVIISTREPSMKVRNLRRDPRVSLVGITDAFYGDWIQVEGTAEIVDGDEVVELLVDYYRRAAGEHPNWDEYRTAMVNDRRVLIRFAIERAGPTVEG